MKRRFSSSRPSSQPSPLAVSRHLFPCVQLNGERRLVLRSSHVCKKLLLHDTRLAVSHKCSERLHLRRLCWFEWFKLLFGSSSGAPRSIIDAPVELSKRGVGLAASTWHSTNSFRIRSQQKRLELSAFALRTLFCARASFMLSKHCQS